MWGALRQCGTPVWLWAQLGSARPISAGFHTVSGQMQAKGNAFLFVIRCGRNSPGARFPEGYRNAGMADFGDGSNRS